MDRTQNTRGGTSAMLTMRIPLPCEFKSNSWLLFVILICLVATMWRIRKLRRSFPGLLTRVQNILTKVGFLTAPGKSIFSWTMSMMKVRELLFHEVSNIHSVHFQSTTSTETNLTLNCRVPKWTRCWRVPCHLHLGHPFSRGSKTNWIVQGNRQRHWSQPIRYQWSFISGMYNSPESESHRFLWQG